MATGARHAYFGHDEWAPLAPGLKTIEDATEIRRRILLAFEAAEREADPERRREWMTFVVVGGGPTGVELAGALGEIANDTLRHDFRAIHPPDARIMLVEALDRVLPTYPPSLSRVGGSASSSAWVRRSGPGRGSRGSRRAAVTVQSSSREETIPTRTVLWAAGVQASSFGRRLAETLGVPTDKAGRIEVRRRPDGTRASRDVRHRRRSPSRRNGTAGRCRASRRPRSRRERTPRGRSGSASRGRSVSPFRYRDKGDVATIGRLSGRGRPALVGRSASSAGSSPG